MQVFVCGMHRSGTSMIARLLNLMGMYFGPEGSGLPANRENPKGFWERRDIVELNDQLLAATESVWFDIHAFLTRDSTWRPLQGLAERLRAKVLDIDACRPWFIKDPRLCLTLPYWLEHCERPVAVVCSRSPQSVIASLAKRTEITGLELSIDEGVALWEAYSVELLRNASRIPRVFVRYEEVLLAPAATCDRLVDELTEAGVQGLRKPFAREIEAFVDATLQRSGARAVDASSLPARVAALDGALLREGDARPTLSRDSLDTLEALRRRLSLSQQSRRLSAALKNRRLEIEAVLEQRSTSAEGLPWTVDDLRRLVRRSSGN